MKLKNIINVILIAVLSISLWEIGQKQWEYYKAKKTYEEVQNEKTRSNDINDYLKEHGYVFWTFFCFGSFACWWYICCY